jgi:crotonobetainyl-CoA:carnitine CoA-transferase CaiB-like acyl-CoA transferase
MGGMFAAIGILAALLQRARTGTGQLVKSALFENNVFLMATHMAQFSITGKPAPPMPARTSAWAVYDVFETRDEQVFVAVVSDSQWHAFCQAFDQPALLADAELATNRQRVAARERFMPTLRALFGGMTRAEVMVACEHAGLPFAPVTRPQDLLVDPHLACPGAMVDVTLPDGRTMPVPALPLEMDGRRFARLRDVPRIGEHSAAIAAELGYPPATVARLVEQGVLGLDPTPVPPDGVSAGISGERSSS